MSIEVKDLGTTPTKKPSKELVDLIKNCIKYVNNLHSAIDKVKQKGRFEGFTDYEILDLVRTHLKKVLTYRQIKWLVIEKEQLTIKRQLEIKQIQESKTIDTSENKPVRLETTTSTQTELETELIPNLRVTINTQAQYIETLENQIEEKKKLDN